MMVGGSSVVIAAAVAIVREVGVGRTQLRAVGLRALSESERLVVELSRLTGRA